MDQLYDEDLANIKRLRKMKKFKNTEVNQVGPVYNKIIRKKEMQMQK